MAVKKSAAATARTPTRAETVTTPKAPETVAAVSVAKVEPAAKPAPIAKAAPVTKPAAKAAPAASAAKAAKPVPAAKVAEPVATPSEIEKTPAKIVDAPVAAPSLKSEEINTPAEVAKHMEKITKSAEEFVAFGQGNIEAFLKSSQLLATGLQDLGKHVAATAQAQYEEAVANAKALTSVKSVKEAVELQTTLAKTAIEKALAETGKLTDASVKLAETVSAPIAARVTLAVEKFGKAA